MTSPAAKAPSSTTSSSSSSSSTTSTAFLRGSVAPAFTAALTLVASLAAPGLHVSPLAASVVVFAGGAIVGLAGLGVAAQAAPPPKSHPRVALTVAALAAVAVVAAAWARPPFPWHAALCNAALVAAAHALGALVGERIEHPGHLLPASFIAAAADLASTLHPSGPTHAIASSERALSVLAVAFPIPGVRAAAPVLGVGDLVFCALVFGCARAHRLGLARPLFAVAVGVAAAGVLAAELAVPVPALVTIAIATVALMREARTLRPHDVRTARSAMGLAVVVVLAVLARAWLAA